MGKKMKGQTMSTALSRPGATNSSEECTGTMEELIQRNVPSSQEGTWKRSYEVSWYVWSKRMGAWSVQTAILEKLRVTYL